MKKELETTLLRIQSCASIEGSALEDVNRLLETALEQARYEPAGGSQASQAEVIAEASQALLRRGIAHVILLPTRLEAPENTDTKIAAETERMLETVLQGSVD